jgi:thiazole synthase ThiGH ThiG subunit
MAYSSSSNPVRAALVFGLTDAKQMFIYESTHIHSVVESTSVPFFLGAGYGSPGVANAGMKVGDLLINICQATSGTSAITFHRVTSLTTSTGFSSLITPILSPAGST